MKNAPAMVICCRFTKERLHKNLRAMVICLKKEHHMCPKTHHKKPSCHGDLLKIIDASYLQKPREPAGDLLRIMASEVLRNHTCKTLLPW